MCLTFNVGENRSRVTRRKLTPRYVFNLAMKGVKVPKEFSRRIRDLDFSVFKAQEFRNTVLFLFPLIVQCLEPEAKERKLWLYLAFMLRSCTLPNEEFNHNHHIFVTECGKFFIIFSRIFLDPIIVPIVSMFYGAICSKFEATYHWQNVLPSNLNPFMVRCVTVSLQELYLLWNRFFKKFTSNKLWCSILVSLPSFTP